MNSVKKLCERKYRNKSIENRKEEIMQKKKERGQEVIQRIIDGNSFQKLNKKICYLTIKIN